MSAYLIAFVTPHNMAWFESYQAAVPKIIHSHGGKYLGVPRFVPGAVKTMEGSLPAPSGIVLFTFPSMEAISNFLEDPAYQPFRAARIAATESNFSAFENDDEAPQFIGQ